MKDIMFIIGVLCWVIWLVNTIYYTVKETNFLIPKTEKVVQFLAITLVILSWYIV